MSKLSDEQVVRRLAPRLPSTFKRLGEPHPLLTSRDALAPVLAGLSKSEQCELDVLIWDKRWRKEGPLLRSATWLLTLPARDLAHLIAEAIGEPEVGKESK